MRLTDPVGGVPNAAVSLAHLAGHAGQLERWRRADSSARVAPLLRVDADGQHPAAELSRLLGLVRADRCDVAVGSRFVSGDGYEPYRYRPTSARRFGTALLRRAMTLVLRRPFRDATSGSKP